MSTTAFRIELLIIGFQASIWVLLLFNIKTAFGFISVHSNFIKEASVAIIFMMLAWFYSLGSIVDGVTSNFKHLFQKTDTGKANSSLMRLKYPDAYKELISSDFQLRLLRSTAINLLITGIILWARWNNLIIGIVLIALSIMTGLSWIRREKRIRDRRAALYETAEKIA